LETVPTHPELTKLSFGDHLAKFDPVPDGRLFSGVRGGELPTITYRRAWAPIDRLRMTGISLIYDPATRTLRTDTTDSLVRQPPLGV
jgi:hypothetical protein